MFDQVERTWTSFNRLWAGRLLGAMILPGWLLIMAAAEHGPPAVSSVTAPVLTGIVLAGGLFGAALGLQAVINRRRVEDAIQARAANPPAQTILQHILGVMGGISFLAAVYQVVWDFNVFSQDHGWSASIGLSSWEALFILCVVQFVCFFAHAHLARRD